jgi:hypothetical protein
MWYNGEKVSATRFFLPQRRPRVWDLFLKVRRGMGPRAIREHERELDQAFDFISKGQTMSHEALNRILDRYPLPYADGPKIPAKKGAMDRPERLPKGRTSKRNNAFSDDDVQHGQCKLLKGYC